MTKPVEGQTLQDLLAASGPLTRERCLHIISEIAAALDQAHASGAAHGHISPATVVVGADGIAQIAGCEAARPAGARAATGTGMAVGLPHYLAPEQVKGDPVSARTDQFGLAGVAYTLLTGRRPFDAHTAASWCHRVLTEDPIPVQILTPGIGAGVDRVLRKAMAKNPAHRFASCSEFVDALRSAWVGTGLPERVIAPRPKAPAHSVFILSRLRGLLSSRTRQH